MFCFRYKIVHGVLTSELRVCCHISDGDKRDCADAHRNAGDYGRDTCRQVESLCCINRQVGRHCVVSHKPHKDGSKDKNEGFKSAFFKVGLCTPPLFRACVFLLGVCDDFLCEFDCFGSKLCLCDIDCAFVYGFDCVARRV